MFIFPFNLQRFSEGAGVAASAASTPSGNTAGVNQNVTENGGVDGQPANGTGKGTDERSQYENVKRQYKKYYDEDVKNQVTRRHKDYNQLKAAKAEQDEFINLMNTKYGTSDLKSLREAIDKDDGFWEDQADKANMTVEQFKANLKLKSERDSARRELSEIRANEQARAQYNVWFEEAKSVEEIYPEFDLNKELQNESFRNMLSAKYANGFMPSMLQIYEMIHRDEILEKQKASVQKSTLDNIRARGLRPDEAGSESGGAVDFSKSAANMTRKERADIAKRVKGGNGYSFSS